MVFVDIDAKKIDEVIMNNVKFISPLNFRKQSWLLQTF